MSRKARKKSTTHTIPKLSEFVIDGKPTEFCWNYCTTLAEVVVVKYFNKYLEFFSKEDLIQMAISDVISFAIKLASLQNDSDIKNLRNVLFTRIRNTLSNFIFRSNKCVSTDDTILDTYVVYPKSTDIKHDLIDLQDLMINDLNSFRETSLHTWDYFKKNGATTKYTFNESSNTLDDWKTYSEIRNMKTPCALIPYYNEHTEEQVETLANKLDAVTGQNHFNTLYQLLGDKFLAFLDVFQEDNLKIPSTSLVKQLLTDIAILRDSSEGISPESLALKYNKDVSVIKNILLLQDLI